MLACLHQSNQQKKAAEQKGAVQDKKKRQVGHSLFLAGHEKGREEPGSGQQHNDCEKQCEIAAFLRLNRIHGVCSFCRICSSYYDMILYSLQRLIMKETVENYAWIC